MLDREAAQKLVATKSARASVAGLLSLGKLAQESVTAMLNGVGGVAIWAGPAT